MEFRVDQRQEKSFKEVKIFLIPKKQVFNWSNLSESIRNNYELVRSQQVLYFSKNP